MGNHSTEPLLNDSLLMQEAFSNGRFFELLPAAIYICDSLGYITNYNHAAALLWGREPELGKDLWCGSWKIFNSDGNPMSLDECPMAITLKTGKAVQGQEIIIETPDGLRRHIQPFPQPVFDSLGNLSGAVNMLVDITDNKREKQSIKDSEERFRFMADIMPQKVWTCSPEGKINYLNRQWLDYTGISLEQAMSAEGYKIIHPEDMNLLKNTWIMALRSGDNFEVEQRFRRKDGEYRWHLVRGVVQKDSDGRTIQWVGTNTDIHDKKVQVEGFRKNTLYNRSLIEASLDSLFAISLEGKVIDVNEASIKMTGWSKDQLLSTDFFDYCTQPWEASKAYEKIITKGFVTNLPLKLKHREGHITEVLCNGSVFKDEYGKIQGIVFIARDITEQKKSEKELINAKEDAEQAMRIAEDAMKAKQQFLSNMSHEIRTPMNAIIGFTKVILKMELDPKQREYLQAIKVSGDALIVLINDILDLAKVESGKMVFEQNPFKLSASLATILHLFEYRIQEKNLSLTVHFDPNIPEVLLGDVTRLHQIILNLISNAVKFTNHGGITIKVELLEKSDEKLWVAFSIADTGIGIEESKVGNIFESFQQASSQTSRIFGGTGLGLAIVKQLVEHQGGTITVESVLNEGTTFRFNINFGLQLNKNYDQVETSHEEFTPIESNPDRIRVLVAEDIALNQLLIRTLLDEFGFSYEIVSNGLEAIEKLKAKEFDIVLMDLQMPQMNGFECTQYLRNTLRLQLPVIALTADVTTVDLDKCKQIGMNDYIAKPLNEDILLNKINSLVKEYRLKRVTDSEKKVRLTNLDYLLRQTKSNAPLMQEMITLYLTQTPPLLKLMKSCIVTKDWDTVYAAVHKIIPSFAIMGIDPRHENLAKAIQENAYSKQNPELLPEMIMTLDDIVKKVCNELETELELLNKINI